jgi:dihydrofolate synthase/folylpolyglutamate synthase
VNPIDYLFGLEFHGIKLGLDNIRRLMRAAGDPQDSIATVHVAGTNGKGSTLAFLDSILQQSGYRTGRFTSPHLIDVNERFLLNSIPIPDGTLNNIITQYRTLAESLQLSPTFFEMNTAIAFQYFADEKVDLALIETGLGGRFDSTNIIQPKVTAITHIGLDHTQYLGDTLESIAFEKAGIIKTNTPVVLGPLSPKAIPPIEKKARECNAPILAPNKGFTYSSGDDGGFSYQSSEIKVNDCVLGMTGVFQPANAAIAATMANQLISDFPSVSAEAIKIGLEQAVWPGRMEIIPGDTLIIMDAAHNLEAMDALCRSIDRRCVVVLAISNDKPAYDMAKAIEPKSETLVITQFTGNRSYPVAAFSEKITTIAHQAIPILENALDEGLKMARERNIPLLITGSLFTMGQARQFLQNKGLINKIQFSKN